MIIPKSAPFLYAPPAITAEPEKKEVWNRTIIRLRDARNDSRALAALMSLSKGPTLMATRVGRVTYYANSRD